MKRFFLVTPVVLAVGISFAGCKDADKPVSNAPVADRPAASAAKMSDSDLEKAIKAKWDADAQLRQADLSVDAEANENKASLKGTVASQEVRTRAIELAKSVQPGLTINDEIEVKPAG